jgi:type II secretory pathway component PulL
MHVAHLPPRHLWRSAALAALLTLAFMAVLLTTAARLSSDRGPRALAPQSELVAPQAAPPAAHPSRVSDSSWLEPLATPRPLLDASQAD